MQTYCVFNKKLFRFEGKENSEMLKSKYVLIFGIIIIFSSGKTFAQGSIAPENLEAIHSMEDSLLITADSMYHAFIPDEREVYCQRFVKQLVKTLKIPNSFDYTFDKLKDVVNIIYPDDKSFRIFNWDIVPTSVTRRYYGAIQLPGDQLKLYPLIDYTEELGKLAEDSVLTNSKWYGALYYRIIEHEANGQKLYTLFGLNASSPISNKKVLDVLEFTPDGAEFGAPIFNVGSESQPGHRIDRYIMEYKKEVEASLNFDSSLGVIFFDKLVSQVNDPNRKYTYVPSGEYDGFKWHDDQWNYVQDLIPVQNLKDGQAPEGDKPVDK